MSASENLKTIERFYAAFARGDAPTMSACYRDDARFTDPGFGALSATDARAMWTMLTGRAKDLRIEVRDQRASDAEGSAHWTAHYTFQGSGRKVVNEIDAQSKFVDGLIIEHVDTFDFWRWSRQALGPVGLLLGWSPWLKTKVNTQALAQLAKFKQR